MMITDSRTQSFNFLSTKIVSVNYCTFDVMYMLDFHSDNSENPSVAILTVTSPIVINVPTRGLLVAVTKDSFVLWLAKFKYQKSSL